MSRVKPYSYVSLDKARSSGINDCWDVTTKSRARQGSDPSDDSPYLVANEWICSSIGQYLRLPIPAFSLFRKTHEKVLFSSLHFSLDASPDDVEPSILWEHLRRESTGVLLFDIFIGNSDRHNGNIKVDDKASPTRMFVFDHDRALFGEHANDGAKRLNSLTDRLGVTGGSVSRGNRHFLLRTINNTEDFNEWLSAIAETPDRFLHEVCHEVVGFGITVEEADAAYNFLRFRKRRIEELIKGHKDQFKEMKQWGIF